MRTLIILALCILSAAVGALGAVYLVPAPQPVAVVSSVETDVHLACARQFAPDVAKITQCRMAVGLEKKGATERDRAFQQYKAANGL